MVDSTRKLFAFLSALIALAVAVPVVRGAEAEENVERFAFGNGLKVILRPIRGAEKSALVVLYSIGSDHEPAGSSGLSHLAEHVYLTAAAGDVKARTVEAMGRDSNGQTGDRYTSLAAEFANAELDARLRDASARMGDLRVTPDDLARERPRLLAEVDNMFGNFPALASRNNARELIRPTPSGGRRGGLPEQVRAFRTLDVQEHLGRYYRPRNAILVVAGGFDPAVVRASIREQFGRLRPGEAPPKPASPEAPRFGAVREIKAGDDADPDAPTSASLAYLAPAPGSELYAPFLVLSNRLWADSGKLGDAEGFPVYFTPLDDGAVLIVTTATKPGEPARRAFDRLETFVAESVAPPLRDGEPAEVLGQFGAFFQTLPIPDAQLAANPYAVAFALGRREQLGIDPDRFNQALRAVTDESLRKTAAEFLAPSRHAGATVGD